MIFESFTPAQWALAIVGATCIGIAKTGFAGVGMLTILLMAEAIGARASTGVVLPMLIAADLLAVAIYRRHAVWVEVFRLLPPALLGIVLGWLAMPSIPEEWFRRLLGWMVFGMVGLQWWRMQGGLDRPPPTSQAVGWGIGWLAGFTTMLANAAGPITTLYLLMMGLRKYEFVGTSACFFLTINLLKVPFSAEMGLIRGDTLLLNALLLPGIVAGFLLGGWCLRRIPQRTFEWLLVILSAIAALRLIW